MFFNDQFTGKNHPLSAVWLASNLERKLTRHQFLNTSIPRSVDCIVGEDAEPMALRLSSQLLLGVVKIYKHKAKYLQNDCQQALNRLKQAFTPGMVDLPPQQLAMPKRAIAQNTLANSLVEINASNLMPDFPFSLDDMPPTMMFPMAHHGLDRRMSIEVGRSQQPERQDGDDGNNENRLAETENNEIEEARATIGENNHADDDEDRLGGIDLGFDFQDIIGQGQENSEIDIDMPGQLDMVIPAYDDADQPGDMELDVDVNLDDVAMTPPEEQPQTPGVGSDEEAADVEVEIVDQENGTAAEGQRHPRTRRILRVDIDSDINIDYENLKDSALIQKEHPTLDRLEYTRFNLFTKNNSILNSNMALPYGFLDPKILTDLIQRKRLHDQRVDTESSPAKQRRIENDNEVDELLGDLSVGDFGANNGDDLVMDTNEYDYDESGNAAPFYDDEPILEESNDGANQQDVPADSQAILTANTALLASELQESLTTPQDKIMFSELSALKSKKEKVGVFFELLVLATKDAVILQQEIAYGDITVKAKDKLYTWGESQTQSTTEIY